MLCAMTTPNLKRVAERAGVSLSTASRVLSGSTYPVRPELRDRVQQAARHLDYVPNAQARGLLHGNPNYVGMLVGDVGDPYFSALVEGTHRLAGERGCLVSVVNTDRDAEREIASFRVLQSHGVGVVIVAGSDLDDEDWHLGIAERVRSMTENGKQVVLIEPRNTPPGVCAVHCDNVAAGELLGAHLREFGHRRVGVLAGDMRVSSTGDRMAGLTRGLGAEPTVLQVAPTPDGGYAGAAELLGRDPDLTALVGTADQMAIGALRWCRDRGVDVPGELSVAGCNDIWVARELTPALTTVHLPLHEMGAAALRLALEAPVNGARQQKFPVELRPRGSTGLVRGSGATD